MYYLLCSRALDHFYMAVCIHCIAMECLAPIRHLLHAALCT